MNDSPDVPLQFSLRGLLTAVAAVALYLTLFRLLEWEWIVLATGGAAGAWALSSQGLRAAIFGGVAGIICSGFVVGAVGVLEILLRFPHLP